MHEVLRPLSNIHTFQGMKPELIPRQFLNSRIREPVIEVRSEAAVSDEIRNAIAERPEGLI